MNKALVIGSDHHNTLGVVQSLGIKGIPVYVIIDDNPNISFVLKSKYVTKGWVCRDEIDVLNCLKTNFCDEKERAIVIATNDHIASLLDAHYDELQSTLICPNCKKQGALVEWMNKDKMDVAASEVGIRIPLSWIVKKGEYLSGIPFPVMTKSISSLEGGKSNIHVCRTQVELDKVLSEQIKYPLLQVQQFIDKKFEFQFIGCSLNGGEEIIIPGRTHIDRPKGMDNTFFLQYKPLDDSFKVLLDKVIVFIKKTGYSGTFSVEFLRDENGQDYFLEMNFRNDGNAKCLTAAGVNIPYIWYLYNIGGDYKSEIRKSQIQEVSFMPEETYFIQMLLKEVGFGQFIKDMWKADSYAVFSKDDKKPYFFSILKFANKQVHRICRKLLKH